MFTERVAAETQRLGLIGLVVEVGTTEDELADRVSELFGLAHPGGL